MSILVGAMWKLNHVRHIHVMPGGGLTVTGRSQRFMQIVHWRFSSREPLPPASAAAGATFACFPAKFRSDLIRDATANAALRRLPAGEDLFGSVVRSSATGLAQRPISSSWRFRPFSTSVRVLSVMIAMILARMSFSAIGGAAGSIGKENFCSK